MRSGAEGGTCGPPHGSVVFKLVCVCIVLFVKDHPALGGFDWLASGYVRNASPELRKGAFHLNLNSNGH